MNKTTLSILLILILTTLACGVNLVPITRIKTGPTQTEDIIVPLPENSETLTELTLSFGAGSINLEPGAEDAIVEGTASYNVEDFDPEVIIENNVVRIEQGDLNINGIPNFDDDIVNNWDFKLGATPMELTISAGAYRGKLELGGLAISDLDISDGAADVEISFSQPNLVEMGDFRYSTGASTVELEGLANANFDSMAFKSGAGSYKLDFGGELNRDMNVTIEAGVSSITIIIPEGTSAEVSFEGGLSNITTRGAWEQHGSEYVLEGDGPTISIIVEMGAGNLELRDK